MSPGLRSLRRSQWEVLNKFRLLTVALPWRLLLYSQRKQGLTKRKEGCSRSTAAIPASRGTPLRGQSYSREMRFG